MKKLKNNINRIFALTLAGLMTFGSMELSAFAAEDTEIKNAVFSVVPDTDLPENEELLTGYLEQMFYGNSDISLFSVGENIAGAKLSGDEKLAYDALVPVIKEIASGSRTSTKIAIGQELNSGSTVYSVDKEVAFAELYADFVTGDIVTALLADYPYEMYWYDKTVGTAASSFYDSNGYLKQITFSFAVAENYQDSDNITVNATAAGVAAEAVSNAQTILTENEDKSDYEKLVAYRDEIMELVSYDDVAAESGTFSTDNDPWQLIHVFDGDTSTNVVCEGYSKAFQYLCDMTVFDGDVSCYSVSGNMTVGESSGGHMWNIVTIGGENYLVDVTNSDEGTVGSDGTLFLAGTSGSIANGYTFTNTYGNSILFTYDSDMTSYWGSWGDSILKLAAANYSVKPESKVIANTTISLSESVIYTGSEQKPSLTINDGETNLVFGTDYTVQYLRNGAETTDFTNAGDLKVVITGIGNYTGTVEKTYTINTYDIGNVYIAVSDATYTGEPITPDITMTVNGMQLNLNTDFTVYYSNNTNVGTATVTITGIGNFEGEASTTFIISKATPNITAPSAKTDLIYTGSEQELITAGITTGGELQYSLDNVNWATIIPTGTNANTYTVYYKVMGDTIYNDVEVESLTVTIAPKTVTSPIFDGLDADYLHTGSAIEPTFTLKDGKTTISSDEYNVEYTNHTDLGTATITITDTDGGNYTVSGSTTFEIVTHAHVWTYVANEENNTITATCSGEIGTCPVANKTVVITLETPSGEFVYDGTTKSASIIQTPENTFADLDSSDIHFTGDFTSAGEHFATLTYGGQSVSAGFIIQQAPSTYIAPTNLTATYGDTLADIMLPENFTWQDANTTKVGDAGEHIFKVTYTPFDAVNYTTVKDIEVTVTVSAQSITATIETAEGDYTYTGTEIKPVITVKSGSETLPETEYTVSYFDNTNAGMATITVTDITGGNYSFTTVSKSFVIAKAQKAPGMPESALTVSYANTKISDIALSNNWEWQSADKDTVLEVGKTVKATANYVGTDKNNYENTSIEVEVIRAACSHGATQIRGHVDATCSSNGYSGDSYCTICGTKVSSGYSTTKLAHNYVSQITQNPTCTETGIKTHTCTGCGEVLTETLLQTGHDYKSEITVEPTTEREGVRTYTCQNCGNLYTKSIDKLPPEPEKVAPFIKGNDGKEGWDAIESEISKAAEGDIYIIDMNGSSVVSGDVFTAIKGREIIVVFDMDNDITWRVNGKNVTSDNISDIDFNLEVETKEKPLNNIPTDVLSRVTGERTSVNISLAHDGAFGFKAVLSINLGSENAGKYANLFYYNPEVSKLEFMCADDISKDGTATLTFDHASDYTIVVDEESMYHVSTDKSVADENTDETVEYEMTDDKESQVSTDKEAGSTSVNKGARDNWGIIWFLVIGGAALIIILIVIVVIRKKNEIDF